MKNKQIFVIIIIISLFCITIITQRILKTNEKSENISASNTDQQIHSEENQVTHNNDTDSFADKNTDSINDIYNSDPEFHEMVLNQVLESTKELEDEFATQNTVKNKWLRETYLTTQERLKDINKPQTIYGKVDSEIVSELYKSEKEPAVISIMTKNNQKWVSSSMVIDGIYSLGQIEPGEYEVIILNETADHPAITVQNFEMKKNQPSLRLDLNFGKASATVRVYDKDGYSINSDSIELFIGGTADKTTYKYATGIKYGIWKVDHLYEGRYYARAYWDDKKEGDFFELSEGDNEIELRFKE